MSLLGIFFVVLGGGAVGVGGLREAVAKGQRALLVDDVARGIGAGPLRARPVRVVRYVQPSTERLASRP